MGTRRQVISGRRNLAIANRALASGWQHRPRVTPAERRRLLALARRGDERAQAILAIADGSSCAAEARRLGVTRQAVHRWLVNWLRRGGLDTRLHPCPTGRPRKCGRSAA